MKKTNKPINKSISQSINKPINELAIQRISQSTNQECDYNSWIVILAIKTELTTLTNMFASLISVILIRKRVFLMYRL
jgi:hypothetical protein